MQKNRHKENEIDRKHRTTPEQYPLDLPKQKCNINSIYTCNIMKQKTCKSAQTRTLLLWVEVVDNNGLNIQNLNMKNTPSFTEATVQPERLYISKAITVSFLACSGFLSVSSRQSSHNVPKLILPCHRVEECQQHSPQMQDLSESERRKRFNSRPQEIWF